MQWEIWVIRGWVPTNAGEQPIQWRCPWRSYATPEEVHQVNQHGETEPCTNRVNQTICFSFLSQWENMKLVVFTTWEQHHYMKLVQKYLLMKVFLSHEDGSIH